jgi:hypothetical protein
MKVIQLQPILFLGKRSRSSVPNFLCFVLAQAQHVDAQKMSRFGNSITYKKDCLPKVGRSENGQKLSFILVLVRC